MSTIEYKGVTYRHSQFLPLVRALTEDGWNTQTSSGLAKISKIKTETNVMFAVSAWRSDGTAHAGVWRDSPFSAIAKLVEEIKKAGAK